MKKRKLKPNKKHKQFRDDVLAVLRKHGDELSADEMLALGAHIVGQIIALQDQRRMIPERAMEIVKVNIELGNKEVIDQLLNETAGNA